MAEETPQWPDLVNLPEKELVRFLIQESSTLYYFFDFVVEPALGPFPREGWDYIFFAEIDRKELGLGPGLPGDIDVLIVPTWNGKPVGNRAAAIEVKRLALKGPNWNKNVDRYGISQAIGLMKSGFPYVGVLHIIVNSPGPLQNWRTVEEWRVIDNRDHIKFQQKHFADMTSIDACDRQYARLLARHPHPAIGLNCVGVGKSQLMVDNQEALFITIPSTRGALPNPYVHPQMVQNIEALATALQPLARLRNADARALAQKRSSRS